MKAAVLAVALSALAGCTLVPPPDGDGTSEDGEELAGAVYDELSANFTLTAYPSTVYRDGSDVYVSYRATVVNKFRDSYRDFSSAFILDPGLGRYFAAGVEPVPQTAVDLVPRGAAELGTAQGGLGVDVTSDKLVSDRDSLDEAGLSAGRILDLGEEITLWLRWDGGEEKLTYSAPVLDPDGLLSP